MTFIADYWWIWLLGYFAVATFGAVVFPHIGNMIDQGRWGILRAMAVVSIAGVCCVVLLLVSIVTNIVFAVS